MALCNISSCSSRSHELVLCCSRDSRPTQCKRSNMGKYIGAHDCFGTEVGAVRLYGGQSTYHIVKDKGY